VATSVSEENIAFIFRLEVSRLRILSVCIGMLLEILRGRGGRAWSKPTGIVRKQPSFRGQCRQTVED
jgi:hypothetical protein